LSFLLNSKVSNNLSSGLFFLELLKKITLQPDYAITAMAGCNSSIKKSIMQPKFTLNSKRKVLAKVIVLAMIFVVSTKVSFGQKTEAMRNTSTQTDAFINPPPPSTNNQPVVLPFKSRNQP